MRLLLESEGDVEDAYAYITKLDAMPRGRLFKHLTITGMSPYLDTLIDMLASRNEEDIDEYTDITWVEIEDSRDDDPGGGTGTSHAAD